jgi:glycosyltransferase involved in cell wall biosynthesis
MATHSNRPVKRPETLRHLSPIPKNHLVSVIMPSYNQSQYLTESVGNVLTQEYSAIELIIIDGASTDETLDSLRKHDPDPRLHWVSEPDNAPLEAINKGLRMADGDLIGILPTSDVLQVHAIREAI